jgi:hypothetical protein
MSFSLESERQREVCGWLTWKVAARSSAQNGESDVAGKEPYRRAIGEQMRTGGDVVGMVQPLGCTTIFNPGWEADPWGGAHAMCSPTEADLAGNKTVKTFPATAQTMSFGFSPDGKRIYAFCVGQDILVLDSDNGRLLSTIPLAHRNITGIRANLRPAASAELQEQDYLVTFAIIVEDSITDTDTLSLGVLDLKQEHPKLDVIETEPFVENWYTVEGIGTSPETHKAFFVWNDLSKIDYRSRKREAVASLPNSQAVPLIHPDGKKVYCGGQWHSLFVYDADTLKHIDDVELGHSMAGIGMRFVSSDKNL